MYEDILAVYDSSDAPYILKTRELIGSPGVTDVHLTEGENIWFRRHGELIETDVYVPSEGIMMISSNVFMLGSWDRGNRACDFDGKRLRLRFSRSKRKSQLFVRVLPGDVPLAEKIGSIGVISKMIPDILSPAFSWFRGLRDRERVPFLLPTCNTCLTILGFT